MLVGRTLELERLERLLDVARMGHGAALAIIGDAGLGKSALLDAGVDLAADFTVLRARGIESEAAIAYAVLLELLGPRPNEFEALPPPLRAALQSALGLRSGRSNNTVAAALTSLLLLRSEQRPVLVVIDDVQWVDGETAEAVFFAARRIREGRIATLFACREPVPTRISLDGIDQMTLEPLDDESSRRLLVQAAVDPGDLAVVLDASAGNPLALLELGRAPASASATGVDIAERLFADRISALSALAARALLVAALDSSGAADRVGVAAGGRAGLAELERSGLSRIDSGRVELRHPLLRSLVVQRASDEERRRAHLALAEASTPGLDRTRHRALAANAPDAALADELEALGSRSDDRGSSVWALERSAELTSDDAISAMRFLGAARAAFENRDLTRARDLLGRIRGQDDQTVRLGVAEIDARLAIADGLRAEGARALVEVATQLAQEDPRRAVRLLVDAAYTAAHHPVVARDAVSRAENLASDDPVLAFLISAARAEIAFAVGDGDVAIQSFREAAERGDPEPEVHADRKSRLVLVEAMWCAFLFDRAREVAQIAVREARSDGALGELQVALACMFSIEFATGRLLQANAAATEELELAEGFGRKLERREALGHVAWCDAFAGRVEDCRRHVEERHELSVTVNAGVALHPALGLLELGLGDYAAAATILGSFEELQTRRGFSPSVGILPLGADLAEALVRAERRDEALVVLDEFEQDARRLSHARGLSQSHRCRGLLVDDGAYEREFEQAVYHESEQPNPLERARIELCWGERLRRSRRRADARVHLRAARELFERVGADLWVTRAESELAATGERTRKQTSEPRSVLTPQEARVAALVSEGLSNREVAARLFVSVNTVETHLRHLFQKLGVRSRTELVRRFTDLHGSPAGVSP